MSFSLSNLASVFRADEEDVYGDYEDDEMEEYEAERPSRKSSSKSSGKISPFAKKNSESAFTASEVFTICPKSLDDVSELTLKLLDGVSVILNTQECTPELATRALDFACGSVYALNGTFGKISVSVASAPCGIYLFTPEAVNITGDILTGNN